MPMTPSNFRATALDHNRIRFTVTPDDDVIIVYQVGEASSTLPPVEVTRIPKNTGSVDMGGFKPSTQYYFQAAAVNTAGELSAKTTKDGALTAAAPVTPTPPPAEPPAPSLVLQGVYNKLTGKADLSYKFVEANNPYTILFNDQPVIVNGVPMTDTNGDAHPPHKGKGEYRVVGKDGVSSTVVTVDDGATAEPAPTPTPTPVPTPPPGDSNVPDIIVFPETLTLGSDGRFTKFSDLFGKAKAGVTIALRRGQTFMTSSSLLVTEGKVTIGAYGNASDPMPIVSYVGSGKFDDIFDVRANDFTIANVDARTNGPQRFVRLSNWAKNARILRCGGGGSMGHLVQVDSAIDLRVQWCRVPRLWRYGVFFVKCDGFEIYDNDFANSNGGTFEGESVNGEHIVRGYLMRRGRIYRNKFKELEKSCVNMRQTWSKSGDDDKLPLVDIAENELEGNQTLGSLMDGDGDPEDLSMRVDRLWFRHNTVRNGNVTLEMNLLNFSIHNNHIYPRSSQAAFYVRWQKAYAPYRKTAQGKIQDNTVYGGRPLMKWDLGAVQTGIVLSGNRTG
jgi:hypothetical protein